MNFFHAVNMTPAPTGAPATLVTSDLYVHLDFNDTACYPGSGSSITDLANSHSFSNTGATFVPASGSDSAYFDFDGVNDFISSLRTHTKVLNSFTIGCWVNFDSSATNSGTMYAHERNSTTGIRFRLIPTAGELNPSCRLNGSNLELSYDVPADTWVYVVAGYTSGSQMEYYVNGVSVGNRSIGARTYNVTSERIIIGRRGYSTTNYFTGGIAVVHAYDTELTAAQVLQNFNATKSNFGY